MTENRPVRCRLPWRARASVRVTLLGVLLVVVAVAVPVASGDASDAAPGASPAPSCTNPPPANLSEPLRPDQLRERYGLTALHDAGHDGRGQTAALIEVASSVDPVALEQFAACTGTTAPPVTQRALPGQTVPQPSPTFREAQGDAESLVSGAPGLDRIYVLVLDDLKTDFPAMLTKILDGSLTDGRRVDVISLSFGPCRPTWETSEIQAAEPLLQQLAEAGTWFFKAAGDAGSSDCAGHPACVDKTSKEAAIAMGYPASSPWVTAAGGVELRNGLLGEARVWNATDYPKTCSAGGGGKADADLFPRPAFQDVVPDGRVPASRGLPDVAALAGAPGYLNLESGGTWIGNGGTSLAAPLYAGAMASVRSALADAKIAPPKVLNDALYAVAADPSHYDQVFRDVRLGQNDIYDVGCCTAEQGFDLASGLGEIHVDQLAAVLAAAAVPLVPSTPSAPSTPAAVTPAFTG